MATFGDILSNLTLGAGQAVRRNSGDTAFEAYIPATGTSSLAWNGSTSNAIGTYVDADTICAQPNITFNGSLLAVTGSICATVSVTNVPYIQGTCICGSSCIISPLYISTGQYCSSVITGTAPLKVDSTTLNTNLNADLLDGYHASELSGIGWSNLTKGSTVAGCGTVASGDTICCNTFYGVEVGKNITTGQANVGVGYRVLYSNSGGTGNSGLGYNTLLCNRTGLGNAAMGYNAMRYNLTGNDNVGIGDTALYCNLSACNNIGIGLQALYNNTGSTASNNIALGQQSLYCNRGGACNIAFGWSVLNRNISGNNNIGIGTGALYFNTGSCNVGIGKEALYCNTTGSNNIAMGCRALFINQSGTGNIGIGANVLCANIGGSCNVAIGFSAMETATGGTHNIAMGYQALNDNTKGNYNIAIGCQALACNTCGLVNLAIGPGALFCNLSGCSNTAFGYNALRNNISGCSNIITGSYSFCSLIGGCYNMGYGGCSGGRIEKGDYNIAIGYTALCGLINACGSSNIAIGQSSMFCHCCGDVNIAIGQGVLCCLNGGNYNIAIGTATMGHNTTGNCNIALGYNALCTNSSGCLNIALGRQALFCNSSGNLNLGLGDSSLAYNTTGCANTGVGYAALYENTTGHYNVVIGYSAGWNVTGSSNVIIGTCAGYGCGSMSNTLLIANNTACNLIYGEFNNKCICIDNTLITCRLRVISGATSGYILTSDGSGNATWQLPAVTGTSSNVKIISQASHGFAVQDIVGYSGGSYNKPIADGTYDGEIIGIVSACYDANSFAVTNSGYITGLTGLVQSTTYFLSEATAGLLTSTEPTGNTQISKAMLIADSTTTGWVLPYPPYIITSGSSSGGEWGTITGDISNQTDLYNCLTTLSGCSTMVSCSISGNDSTTGWTVTHSFNTYNVQIEVYKNVAPRRTIYTDVSRPTVDTVCVTFESAPATGCNYVILVNK